MSENVLNSYGHLPIKQILKSLNTKCPVHASFPRLRATAEFNIEWTLQYLLKRHENLYRRVSTLSTTKIYYYFGPTRLPAPRRKLCRRIFTATKKIIKQVGSVGAGFNSSVELWCINHVDDLALPKVIAFNFLSCGHAILIEVLSVRWFDS